MNLNLVLEFVATPLLYKCDSYQLPSLPELCTFRGITDVRDVVLISSEPINIYKTIYETKGHQEALVSIRQKGV